MFQTFLTALREGLEAALVIGIIVAYLVKSGRRDRLSAVWTGTGLAIVLSLAVAGVLTFTENELPERAEAAFAGFMSLVAIVLVTSMVFWMKRNAHRLKGELHAKVDDAVRLGWFSVFLMAFATVGREGLETALFLWPTVRAAGSGASPLIGLLVGLVLATALGWLVYRRSVHINLATFFRYTGAALVVVAAGVFSYGIHELQEASFLPGDGATAFDLTRQIPETSWYGTLLKGTLSISAKWSWLQLVAYVAFLVPTMWLFLRRPRVAAAAPAKTAVPAGDLVASSH